MAIVFLLGSQSICQENSSIEEFVTNNGYKFREIAVPDSLVVDLGNIQGPISTSPRSTSKWHSLRSYDKGTDSRICIFLTDTLSSWLQLTESLKDQGIPVRITQSLDEALGHDIVIIYPALASKSLDIDIFKRLKQFPIDGGILIGFKASAPSMKTVFGFDSIVTDLYRENVTFSDEIQNSFFAGSTRGNPGMVSIASRDKDLETIGYLQTDYLPLAEYEDGAAAIIYKMYNNGASIAFGFDPATLAELRKTSISVPENYLENNYNQSLDIFFWIIRNIYKKHSEYPVLMGTVPAFKQIPIVISHPINSYVDLKSAVLYSSLESNKGIQTSYCLTTKYINDTQGQAFFDGGNIDAIKMLKQYGHEVSSRGVSGTPFFGYLKTGDGLEQYPDYRPMVTSPTSAFNETLIGELYVSKFLLDNFIGPVQTFSRHVVKLNSKLFSVIDGAGYNYSSTTTSSQVQTYYPFHAPDQYLSNQRFHSLELPVSLTTSLYDDYANPISTTIFKLSNIEQFGGVAHISIDVGLSEDRLHLEEQIINHYADRAWFGTLESFGQFWRARAQIEIDVESNEDFVYVNIFSPQRIVDLPIEIPLEWQYVGVQPENVRLEGHAKGIIIKDLEGRLRITLRQSNR